MNKKQARILALAWILDEMSHTILARDAPWREDYTPPDILRIERELESLEDLLRRKRDRLEEIPH